MSREDIDLIGKLEAEKVAKFELASDAIAEQEFKAEVAAAISVDGHTLLLNAVDALQTQMIKAWGELGGYKKRRLPGRAPLYRPQRESEAGHLTGSHYIKERRLTTVPLVATTERRTDGNSDMELGWQFQLRTKKFLDEWKRRPDYTASGMWIFKSARWLEQDALPENKFYAHIYMGTDETIAPARNDGQALRTTYDEGKAYVEDVDWWDEADTAWTAWDDQDYKDKDDKNAYTKILNHYNEASSRRSSCDLTDSPELWARGLIMDATTEFAAIEKGVPAAKIYPMSAGYDWCFNKLA